MRAKTQISRILWLETVAFMVIIALSWLHELTDMAHSISGIEYVPDWVEATTETVMVVLVAIPVMILTKRLVSRLYQLEGFLRVCAWCRKIDHDGEWIPLEEFFERKFETATSHGICPACLVEAKNKMRKPQAA
ncbi:MAG TPA: hypothetical protein DC054_13865 [Blastocatellia bacterium]|nr:hypothetical protein [Blastocatellia bacterium]